jgi:putative heme-binding domain-containing protein
LVGATTEDLQEHLKDPEDWTRQHAKRVLKERRSQVLPAVATWVAKLNAADPDYEHHLLEALWTYESLDVAEPNLLRTLLHARDHRARAAAVRVLQYWHDRLTDSMELLTAGVADDHPRVRLEAVRALGQMSDAHAIEVAMRALDRPVDLYVDYALWLTVRELEPHWMPALQMGHLDFGGNTRHLLFALQAVGSKAGIKPLVDLIKEGKIAKGREESVLSLLAAVGGPEELRLVFERALGKAATEARMRASLLSALEQAGRQRSVRPAGDLSRIGKLLAADNEAVRAAAVRLVGLWELESFRPQLLDFARAAATSEMVRKAAFEGLTQLGGPASRQAFEQFSVAPHPAALRACAIAALASMDLEGAARRAVSLLTADLNDADVTELVTAFVQRKGGAAVLAKALANQKLPADMAKLAIRAARASGRETPDLIGALTKAGGLTGGPRLLTARDLEQLVAEVAQRGDAHRGEAIFRRKDLSCMKCHAIAGAGGQVGPDLISIGATAPVDYLIESILLPNKAVKENYHSMVVATKDGRVLTGIKVRETASELILRDAEDREITIPAKDVEEKTTGGSLMPEGLADSLTRAELVDLVRFLSELGKVGPFAVVKARLVRRWQVLEPTVEASQVLQATNLGAATADAHILRWSPAYSTVSGVLPLDVLQAFDRDGARLGLARCQLETSAACTARLKVNSSLGLNLWLDRTPIAVQEEFLLDLTPGLHTLTFAVNLGQRHEVLRCALEDVPGSAGVHIVSGK